MPRRRPSKSRDADGTHRAPAAVAALHRRCGVYTKPKIVRRILDAVGWTRHTDLSEARLLEPAAGNGAFVVEAARRLVSAFDRRNIRPTARALSRRIAAFELHAGEAHVARQEVVRALRSEGVHHNTATACARSWIVTGDFLLSEVPTAAFTHAVGNPPYVRWSRLPPSLKKDYDKRLPESMTGGDLFVPFLDRALDSLEPDGQCGFICSDRWRYMAFAEAFREKWLPKLSIKSEQPVSASEAFDTNVDSYPTVLVAAKRANGQGAPAVVKSVRGKTLAELGCTVRVGPALGLTSAYVLGPDEHDVEPHLLQRWIDGSEISEGALKWTGRRVVVMNGNDGELLVLNRHSRLKTRLRRFKAKLERRSIVLNGALWYRPIDRVCRTDWNRPKILVPELAKVPRACIDCTGAVPSHGVYAIFVDGDNIDAVYDRLANGKLAKALNGIAPRVKGDYLRCYRRFLMMIRV